MKVGNSREYSYYCPDKKVWEETRQDTLIKICDTIFV